MDKLCTLTESQARDLFPRAMRELDASPGSEGTTEDTIFAIVKDVNMWKLATWEQTSSAPEGVLMWDEEHSRWDY
jgi:hypothetical protein